MSVRHATQTSTGSSTRAPPASGPLPDPATAAADHLRKAKLKRAAGGQWWAVSADDATPLNTNDPAQARRNLDELRARAGKALNQKLIAGAAIRAARGAARRGRNASRRTPRR